MPKHKKLITKLDQVSKIYDEYGVVVNACDKVSLKIFPVFPGELVSTIKFVRTLFVTSVFYRRCNVYFFFVAYKHFLKNCKTLLGAYCIQIFGGIWWTIIREKDGSSIADSSSENGVWSMRGTKYNLHDIMKVTYLP